MKITRTASSGVLIEIDGVSVLIDGVAKTLGGYIGTPENLKLEFKKNPPDILAFTHTHEDHYDKEYFEFYKNTVHSPVLIPGDAGEIIKDGILIKSVATRHIGKNDLLHFSYAIMGSRCVWFMGDASPSMLKNMEIFPKPDVLFVPFAFATTTPAWNNTLKTGAKKIVLLHLPKKEDDIQGLWDSVLKTAGNDERLIIPKMEKVYCI